MWLGVLLFVGVVFLIVVTLCDYANQTPTTFYVIDYYTTTNQKFPLSEGVWLLTNQTNPSMVNGVYRIDANASTYILSLQNTWKADVKFSIKDTTSQVFFNVATQTYNFVKGGGSESDPELEAKVTANTVAIETTEIKSQLIQSL